MKKTTYKKDSWHYRINTSENMLIPMINQKYGSVDGYWGKVPPEDSCTYWSNTVLYYLLQVPMMFLVGFLIGLICIVQPLFVVLSLIQFGTVLPELVVGVIIWCVYLSLSIFAAGVYYYNNKELPKVVSDIGEMYDSLKEKHCKKLEFK